MARKQNNGDSSSKLFYGRCLQALSMIVEESQSELGRRCPKDDAFNDLRVRSLRCATLQMSKDKLRQKVCSIDEQCQVLQAAKMHEAMLMLGT